LQLNEKRKNEMKKKKEKKNKTEKKNKMEKKNEIGKKTNRKERLANNGEKNKKVKSDGV